MSKELETQIYSESMPGKDGKFKNIDEHLLEPGRKTIIRYKKVYADYKILVAELNRRLPNVAPYVSRAFYYETIGRAHGLSQNYVCSIICRAQIREMKYRKSHELKSNES